MKSDQRSDLGDIMRKINRGVGISDTFYDDYINAKKTAKRHSIS